MRFHGCGSGISSLLDYYGSPFDDALIFVNRNCTLTKPSSEVSTRVFRHKRPSNILFAKRILIVPRRNTRSRLSRPFFKSPSNKFLKQRFACCCSAANRWLSEPIGSRSKRTTNPITESGGLRPPIYPRRWRETSRLVFSDNNRPSNNLFAKRILIVPGRNTRSRLSRPLFKSLLINFLKQQVACCCSAANRWLPRAGANKFDDNTNYRVRKPRPT